MDEWKSDFNRWLLEKYGDSKSTSQTVTTSYVNNVLSYLQHDRFPEEMDRQQRHTFKHKVFFISKF